MVVPSKPTTHRDNSKAQLEAVVSFWVAVSHFLHGPQGRHIRGHLPQAVDINLVVFVANALASDECVSVFIGVSLQGAHGQHDNVTELRNRTRVKVLHVGRAKGLL